MSLWRKLDPCGRYNKVRPMSSLNKASNQKPTKQVSEILSAYLWFHGIGFSRGICFKDRSALVRTLTSIVFVILWEGNFLYVMSLLLLSIYKRDFRESKGEIATVVNLVVNVITRFLFYSHRVQLSQAVEQLCSVYDRVADEGVRSMKNFKGKLVLALLLNDLMYFGYVYWLLSKNSKYLFALYDFVAIPLPCKDWLYRISYALSYHSRCTVATTAYFCTLCYVLERTLRQLTAKLLREDSAGNEDLLKLYKEIDDSLRVVEKVMHPFLVTAFVYFMSMQFQKTYQAMLYFENALARFNILFAVVMFFNQLLICASASCVANAAKEARKLPPGLVSRPKRLQIFLQRSCAFRGFRILDSVNIDLSLIVKSTGVLFSYGVLLATFNTS